MVACSPEPIEQVPIHHDADVSVARRAAGDVAARTGLGESVAGEVVIAVSEAAQNIVDHGGAHGEVTLSRCPEGCVHFAATDRGGDRPLLAREPRRAPAGRGNGLGAIGRAMDVVQVQQGANGTSLHAHRWALGAGELPPPRVVVVARPHARERVIGDGWLVGREGATLRIAVIDGLGHGRAAAEASQAAIASLARTLGRDLTAALAEAHGALGATRGAAAAVAELRNGWLHATGVGNVRTAVYDREGSRWSPVATEAVLGHGRPASLGTLRTKAQCTAWTSSSTLVMHSDGVSRSAGRPERAPSTLLEQALGLFAAHAKSHDDATLLLAR